MERDEIAVKVKLRLDELGPFEEGQVIDSGRIDAYLDEAGDTLQKLVPPWIVEPSSFSGATVPYSDNTSGYIVLPTDFLKLVSFKMAEWSRSVTEAITEHHPLYKRQSYPELRGSYRKPVAVFRTIYGVGKVLDYYSVPEGLHTVDHATYLASVTAENLDEILIDPLTWHVAGLILNTVGEFEIAKAADAKVMEWINSRIEV